MFSSADFHVGPRCGHQALARTPSQGTTHNTDDLAGSFGLSYVLGASLEETLGEDSPLEPEDHRNALDSKVLQKHAKMSIADRLAQKELYRTMGE